MAKPIKQASDYDHLRDGIVDLLETARQGSVRVVNAIVTAAYWETGRRIVEFELQSQSRAAYGKETMDRLARDLTARFGRGFSRPNLTRARQFYQAYTPAKIRSTLSNKSSGLIRSTASDVSLALTHSDQVADKKTSPLFTLADLAAAFPLSWSHYVLLLRARSPEARSFYEEEALRCHQKTGCLKKSAKPGRLGNCENLPARKEKEAGHDDLPPFLPARYHATCHAMRHANRLATGGTQGNPLLQESQNRQQGIVSPVLTCSPMVGCASGVGGLPPPPEPSNAGIHA
jgi:hypothetical protein